MKIKNYLWVAMILFLTGFSGYAQCNFEITGNAPITCGAEVQLFAEPLWQEVHGPINSNASCSFFTSKDIGYAGTINGTFHKTVDGGVTWSSKTINTAYFLVGLYFTDSNTGYLLGRKSSGTGSKIFKTTDAGDNWVEILDDANIGVNSINFVNANTGFVTGSNGLLLKTSDAGVNWVTKNTNITGDILKVQLFDATNGYAPAFTGDILKTTDGGETWTLKTGITKKGMSDAYFTDQNSGCAVRGDSIFRTTDGGVNWTTKVVNTNGWNLFGVRFLDANTGYVLGVNAVWKTIDAGKSWIYQNVPGVYGARIHFADPKVFYIVGYEVHKLIIPDAISWSPSTGLNATNISNPIANPSVTTTYTITTNSGGCTATNNVTVSVQPLTANAYGNRSMVCGGSVGLDVGTNYTGTGTLAYSWSPATGLSSTTTANPVSTAITETKYYVTVTTPNGCTAIDSSILFVYPLKLDAMGNKTITCGGMVQLDKAQTNYTGTGTLSYSWSPATGLNAANISNPQASPIQTTKYYITVATPNGCTVTDSVTVFVAPLTAEAGGDVSLVCGGSVSFNGILSNYADHALLTYSWSPASGLNSSTIEKPIATVTKDTKYYVTITTPNGCTATDSITVLVDPFIANAGNDKIHICGTSVQLDNISTNYTGSSPLSYSWLPTTGLSNASIPNPTSSADGITYTVTVTTSNGCQDSDEIKVGLTKMSAPQICMVGVDSTGKNIVMWNKFSATAIDSVYIYRETTISGNYAKIGSVSYSKTFFKDQNSQPEVKSNKYKISVLDSCNLETEKSPNHKTMHLAITKGIGTSWNLIWESYEGFAVPTYNIYRGTSKNDLQFLDATSGGSNQYTNYNPPPGDLYYQVEVVNPNPCADSALLGPLRSNVARNTFVGIKENENDFFSFSVYPNPATELITVNVEKINVKNAVLSIYNTVGGLVKSVALEQNNQQINVSDLTNGFYMIELKSGNQVAKQKLVLQK